MAIAEHAFDRSAAKYLDIWCAHDPMGEITGHAFAKIIAADQEKHLARVLRKINSRLTSGVAAADQHNVRRATHLRFVRRGRVINTAAFELIAIFHAEAAVLRA